MAEKNFARSGTADTDLLADDDPLSELARIVGYDPQPVPRSRIDDVPAIAPASSAVAREARPDLDVMPSRPAVFALEDELMREFELYDTPKLDPADHIATDSADRPDAFDAPFDEEPVDETMPAVPDIDLSGEAPLVQSDVEPAFDFPIEPAAAVDSDPAYPGTAQRVDEPDLGDVAFSAPAEWPVLGPVEPVVQELPDDYSAEETDAADDPLLEDVFAADADAADREPVPSVDIDVSGDRAEVAPERSEPVFLGFQPADFPDVGPSSTDLDLDRELELSLGHAFAGAVEADERRDALPETDRRADRDEPAFAEPFVASDDDNVDTPPEPADFGMDAEASVLAGLAPLVGHAETVAGGPFESGSIAAPDEASLFDVVPAYAEPTVDYDPEATVHHHASQEQAEKWLSEPAEDFSQPPSYDVAAVSPSPDAYDLDDLLAEVERFPVPEPQGRALGETRSGATGAEGNPFLNTSLFTRATPFARVQPAVARVEPAVARVEPAVAPVEPEEVAVPEPIAADERVEARPDAPVAADDSGLDAVDLAFEDFELELDDLELDFDASDFAVEDDTAATTVEPPVAVAGSASGAERSRFAERVQEDVAPPEEDREPAVLPFDPSLIATTEESVTPVAELNVPQLPLVEKVAPQAEQSDYDFDIDAEMAQLFAEPAATRDENIGAAAVAPSAFAADGKGGPDEFEKALEEDFRRSMSETDRMAIPIDASRNDAAYAPDGYDERSGRGRRILVAACAASLVVLGGIGAYAWMFGGSGENSGEPRIILADNDPVKVVPEEKGGKSVPNQDKAVYDRVAGQTEATPQQEQLVTSNEEPMDVVQRTLTPESLPLEGRDDPLDGATPVSEEDSRLLPGIEEAATTGNEDATPVIAPRKVRTMIVKPDGTLVAREEVVPEPASDTIASDQSSAAAETGTGATETAARDVSPADRSTARLAEPTSGATAAAEAGAGTTEGPADADVSVADTNPAAIAGATADTTASGTTPLEDVASADVEETAPVRVVRTTSIGAGETAGNTPIPESRPAEQPVSVVGTVTEQGNVRDEQQAAATPAAETETATTTATESQTEVAAVNPGGYVIQIASLPSEAEAKRSYDNLSSRFSGVIGGRGVDIRRAEIPNKGTYYRVRIPAGSREEANALCSRYKGAGGSCLVTR